MLGFTNLSLFSGSENENMTEMFRLYVSELWVIEMQDNLKENNIK